MANRTVEAPSPVRRAVAHEGKPARLVEVLPSAGYEAPLTLV